jgi:hypothetical protein
MIIQDFSFVVGDTRTVNSTVGVNLSGSTVRWYLKNSVDDNDSTYVLMKDTVGGKITVTDAAAGKFTFELTAAETAALNPNFNYYHECKVIDSLFKVTTVFSGSVRGVNGYSSASYATVEYADVYFDSVLFPEPWTTTDAETKAKALRMASKKIDSLVLIGRRVSPDQGQEFPRSIYNSGSGCWVDESEVAECVKEATCEEALSLLRGGQNAGQRADLQRQGVKSFTLGKLSETYKDEVVQTSVMQSAAARNLLLRYTGGSRAIG